MKVVFAVGLVLATVYSCANLMNRDSGSNYTPSPAQVALQTCRDAIRRSAKNPSSVEIPYASDQGAGDRHTFVWPKGAGLIMINSFGARLDTSAACSTDASGAHAIGLMVDGAVLL